MPLPAINVNLRIINREYIAVQCPKCREILWKGHMPFFLSLNILSLNIREELFFKIIEHIRNHKRRARKGAGKKR